MRKVPTQPTYVYCTNCNKNYSASNIARHRTTSKHMLMETLNPCTEQQNSFPSKGKETFDHEDPELMEVVQHDLEFYAPDFQDLRDVGSINHREEEVIEREADTVYAPLLGASFNLVGNKRTKIKASKLSRSFQ